MEQIFPTVTAELPSIASCCSIGEFHHDLYKTRSTADLGIRGRRSCSQLPASSSFMLRSKAATDRIYFLNDAVKGPKAICGWTLIAHAIPSSFPAVAYLSLLIVPKRDDAVMEECGPGPGRSDWIGLDSPPFSDLR